MISNCLEKKPAIYTVFSAAEKLKAEQWKRIWETMEFCKRMKYKKIGVAFCKEHREEMKILVRILHRYGFHVVTAMCQSDGLLQAAMLNEQETDFNLTVGLCMSQNAPFYKYSRAMVTTVVEGK
mgnify:CR=1 FL=1